MASLEECPRPLRDFKQLAGFEGVVVGDDDLRLLDVVRELLRDYLAVKVVLVRIARPEHAQTVADRESRRND